jgi:hypothetical protein
MNRDSNKPNEASGDKAKSVTSLLAEVLTNVSKNAESGESHLLMFGIYSNKK